MGHCPPAAQCGPDPSSPLFSPPGRPAEWFSPAACTGGSSCISTNDQLCPPPAVPHKDRCPNPICQNCGVSISSPGNSQKFPIPCAQSLRTQVPKTMAPEVPPGLGPSAPPSTSECSLPESLGGGLTLLGDNSQSPSPDIRVPWTTGDESWALCSLPAPKPRAKGYKPWPLLDTCIQRDPRWC